MNLLSRMNRNLTWGRLYSRLSEMAPEPHPTSKHVCWMSPFTGFICRSVSTSSTNSCTNVQRKHCSDYVWSLEFHCTLFACVACFLLSNLCFRSWYEHRRSHLQCQIPEVPLLNHILHRHSTPNTWITKSKKKKNWIHAYTEVYVETLYLERRLVQSFHICSIFSLLRNSVNFFCSRISIWKRERCF